MLEVVSRWLGALGAFLVRALILCAVIALVGALIVWVLL